ncbi:hypothetical protein KGA66_13195 [Actinocrinis puniceicyclus]|uniref:Phage tail protein n=1 Tax=Actinocrinis puniceicyclus TaxID=977794 RepID=A0A8J7WKJ5_9ACTN|nr:phage tail protein [Actinocrinis puniceicyclus]MBS2964006.1 hypothetical protein [Actinocrinis puniceicyclus]
MRGLISEQEPGVLGVAAALRQAIPAVYQEDPLFMDLCAAFDEVIAPLVTAVDCFDAYLDPYLAPEDFLPWLADLVGCRGAVRQGAAAERAQIAAAVRDHALRGTPSGVREAAARAAGVPVEQVELDDPGGTRWSTVPGGADSGWPRTAPRVRVRVGEQDAQAARSAVRAAIEEAAGVHCAIAVDVAEAGAAPNRRARPQGARTYGGTSES